MFTFEEFKEKIRDEIRSYLPANLQDCTVSLESVRKNNGIVLDGLTIRESSETAAPIIYLEKYYERYQEGEILEDLLSEIAEQRAGASLSDSFSLDSITDFQKAKDHIVCRVCNLDSNLELLKTRPHKIMDDLAVTYHVLLDSGPAGLASVAVTNELLSDYGITRDKLHAIAMENTAKLLPPLFLTMEDMMGNLFGITEDDPFSKTEDFTSKHSPMYVLTNRERTNGASAMLDPDLMDRIRDHAGDYYILPSSTHEVLIVPKDGSVSLENLEQLVHDVNRNEVSPEERLSDHVYSYDPVTRSILRASLLEQNRKVSLADVRTAVQSEKERLDNRQASHTIDLRQAAAL